MVNLIYWRLHERLLSEHSPMWVSCLSVTLLNQCTTLTNHRTLGRGVTPILLSELTLNLVGTKTYPYKTKEIPPSFPHLDFSYFPTLDGQTSNCQTVKVTRDRGGRLPSDHISFLPFVLKELKEMSVRNETGHHVLVFFLTRTDLVRFVRSIERTGNY